MKKKIITYLQQTNDIWKMAIGSGLAWQLAKIFGSEHPYLAPLSVILCLQISIDKSINSAYQRIIGTIGGVIITAFIARYLGVHGWSIALIVLLGMGIGKLLKLAENTIHQLALSAVLVLEFQIRSADYATDRIRDTIIGVLLALLINILVFPPDFSNDAKNSLLKFTDKLSEHFSKISIWLKNGCPLDEEILISQQIKNLSNDLKQTTMSVKRAVKNSNANPLLRKKRNIIQYYDQQLSLLKNGYHHLSGMMRLLTEWSQSQQLTEEDKKVWKDYTSTIATHIKEWKIIIFENEGEQKFISPNQKTPISEKNSLEFIPPKEFDKTRYYYSLRTILNWILEDFKKDKSK